MTFEPEPSDLRWLELALELSAHCAPSSTAYSVGTVIVSAAGDEMARGFSREIDALAHAEEAALGRLRADDPRLPTATVYCTLEPCSERRSRQPTCATRLIRAGVSRVVILRREPARFIAAPNGVGLLRGAGIRVDEFPADVSIGPTTRSRSLVPW